MADLSADQQPFSPGVTLYSGRVTVTLSGIYRYPVKSCRREELLHAEVEPWGLSGDRRWMIVDPGGSCVTAREYAQLVLVDARLDGNGLLLRAPGRPELVVKAPDTELVSVDVHGTELAATPAAPDVHAWFSELLGAPARLVYLDDATRRRPSPNFSTPDDRVSFADAYPLLLTSVDSLAALNVAIAAGARAAEAPLPITRFRPNLVVSGAPAWAEDGWRRVRIGSVTFRAVKGCDRCVMTLIDPETAAKGKEPIATLTKVRRWDGATWFGMQLIPASPAPGNTVRVGDPVEILEAVESDGPPR
jgi:uncharacterized protein YcbX